MAVAEVVPSAPSPSMSRPSQRRVTGRGWLISCAAGMALAILAAMPSPERTCAVASTSMPVIAADTAIVASPLAHGRSWRVTCEAA